MVGHPVPFKMGKHSLLVGYVSMKEYYTCQEIDKEDNFEATKMLIYYSLCRADPKITKKEVERLIKKQPDFVYKLVGLIEKISLPTVEIKEGGDSEEKQQDNLKTVYRRLAKEYQWTSEQVGSLSPAQIFLYLTGGEDGSGIQKMSATEYANYRAKRGLK